MDHPKPPLNRPLQGRAMRTKAAMLAAVERVVASEGPEAVTTTRIASETALSVGSVYRYFPDRDALLLAAYDATVMRIVAACEKALNALPPGLAREDAARRLLSEYLAAAESIPAHSGLLRAMRSIRPVETDQSGGGADISGHILAPFVARFGPRLPDGARVRFLGILLGTMVDLYLVTSDPTERLRLRDELEAHMLFALGRI